MKKKLKIIFMGTSDLAGIILEELVNNNFEILAVVTQPDNENSSRKIKTISPVKETAKKNKIKILQPEKLDSNFLNELKNLNPDLIIVAAYGKILPEEILKLPKLKSINVHASLLPKLRGPSPIQNSLLNGDTKTGVTIMLMDKGIDTGDILSQKKINIELEDDYITLTSKLSIAGSNLLIKTISKLIEKKIKPLKQNNEDATLCQLIERNDGKINWNNSSIQIYNAFRAFRVWPGIFTFWDNKGSIKKISLNKIATDTNSAGESYHLGEVFKREDKRIYIQTSEGVIIIEKIQLAGKCEVDAIDFMNGYPSFIGSILK